MPQTTEEQIADLIELQDAHEKRLRVLELQSAQSGNSTPAEIIVEVRDIQSKVISISVQITKLQIADTKAEHRAHRAENTSDLGDVSLQLSNSTETIRKFQQAMFVEIVNLASVDSILRTRRQRVTTLFYVAILVMLAIDILIRFWR